MLVTRKNKNRHPQSDQTIVIEVNRSGLTLTRTSPLDAAAPHEVHWRHVALDRPANSFHDEQSRYDLKVAFEKLVEEEGLAGDSSVSLALSSEFCVTRVVAGENEFVAQELRGLAERSAMYLSLGTGEKISSESIRPIDAKRQAARMTITNRITLDTICQAAAEAGLNVDCVEHSMIGLCRAVGATGLDQESPVLIVEIGHRGVELGISHRGQLLLDYRPGGMRAKEQIAETVLRHRKRLQRYCNRVFQFPNGQISQVIVCGDPADVPKVCAAFRSHEKMVPTSLDAKAVADLWTIQGDDVIPASVLSSLGVAVGKTLPTTERSSPNLVASYIDARRNPLIPELIRIGWPIAIVLALCVLMWTVNLFSGWRNATLHSRQRDLQADVDKVRLIQMQLLEANARLQQADRVKSKLFNPSLQELMGGIAGCMPDGVWLVDLRVEKDGSLQITGKSRADQAVFDFVGLLKKAPHLSDVTLEGTRPDRHLMENVTHFEIRCKYSDHDRPAERSDKNG